jgi:pilus assembly protein Flp/PilA
MTLLAKFRKLLKRNDGATAIEYGLIAAGIALAIIPAVQLVGTKLSGTFDTVATSLENGSGRGNSCDPEALETC